MVRYYTIWPKNARETPKGRLETWDSGTDIGFSGPSVFSLGVLIQRVLGSPIVKSWEKGFPENGNKKGRADGPAFGDAFIERSDFNIGLLKVV
jgi:hypothetical protein